MLLRTAFPRLNASKKNHSRFRKKLIFLSIILFCTALPALFLSPEAVYAAPNEKDFKNDMSYYHKVSKAEKFKSNDRLYILDRLRKKYGQAEFDLSELFAEIDKWYGVKQKEEKAAPAPALGTVAPTPLDGTVKFETEEIGEMKETRGKTGKLVKARLTETGAFSRLILDVPGTERYKDILKKDEKGLKPPALIIYLYDTQEKLQPASKNIVTKTGVIRQVQSKSVSNKPPTVRVAVSLRKDLPYHISKQGEQLILTVDKNKAAKSTNQNEKKVTDNIEKSTAETVAGEMQTASSLFQAPEEETLLPAPESTEEPPSSAIEPGDILNVRVSPTEDLSQQKVVQSNGTIPLSPLGNLKASGLTAQQLEVEIAKKLSEYFPNPKVSISIRKVSPKQIYLTGWIKSPGAYDYEKPLKCFELISKTGGFMNDSDKKNVAIYRGTKENKTLLAFNVEEFLVSADPSKDIPLEPGDVIEVQRAANFVYVVGAVKSPGRYDYQEGLKVMQMIYAAGGFDERARTDQVRVMREENGKKAVLEVNAKSIMDKHPEADISIKVEDVIIVPQGKGFQSRVLTRGVLPWGVFLLSLGLVLALLI